MVMTMLRVSPDGSTLTVVGAHTTDGGKYTCVATNTAGEEDRIFNLNVYGEWNCHFSPYLLYAFIRKGLFGLSSSAPCDRGQQ